MDMDAVVKLDTQGRTVVLTSMTASHPLARMVSNINGNHRLKFIASLHTRSPLHPSIVPLLLKTCTPTISRSCAVAFLHSCAVALLLCCTPALLHSCSPSLPQNFPHTNLHSFPTAFLPFCPFAFQLSYISAHLLSFLPIVIVFHLPPRVLSPLLLEYCSSSQSHSCTLTFPRSWTSTLFHSLLFYAPSPFT